MADEATRHNQAAYDLIAGLYAARQAERDRSFPDLRAAFAARLPRMADIADLGCGPAGDGALFAQAGHRVTGIDRSAGMLAYAATVLPGLSDDAGPHLVQFAAVRHTRRRPLPATD